MRMRMLSLTLAGSLLACVPSRADELLPASKPIEPAIDHYIDIQLKAKNVKLAQQVDDAILIRRLSLDLIGRIPTVAETRAFVESKDTDKRIKLVDRLLASPAFVRHQANQFDVMFTPQDGSAKGSGLREYFTRALSENRPWNEIFELADAKKYHEFPGDKFSGLVNHLQFTPDGQFLIGAGGAGE